MDLAAIEERLDLVAAIQKPQWGRTLWRDARDLVLEVRRLRALLLAIGPPDVLAEPYYDPALHSSPEDD